MDKPIQYADTLPYPPIRVDGPNPRYAEAMLSNIGSCNSEMSAVSLYFYNSIISQQKYPDVAEGFHKISIVEMHHLDIFGSLAFLLGADPRLWSTNRNRLAYWSPNCNNYPRDIVALIKNAIQGENEAIAKYRQQAEWIQDENIVANIKRIILDEERHIVIFNEMLQSVQ